MPVGWIIFLELDGGGGVGGGDGEGWEGGDETSALGLVDLVDYDGLVLGLFLVCLDLYFLCYEWF